MQPDGCATRRCRSQARDLRPHALRSCYSFEPPALACRSRFGVALKISQSPIAAPKRLRQQVLPQAKQRRAARRRRICVISGFSRVRQEAIASPSSQGQKQIADSHPCMVPALKRHPNTKHHPAKRAACSSGRTVSDEIQQLQTTTRSLISPREI